MKKFIVFLVTFIGVLGYAQVDVPPVAAPREHHPKRDQVEVLPEFPGGMKAFVTKVSDGIRTKKITGEGQVRAEPTFDIDEKGNITNVRVAGKNSSLNEELEREIKSVKTKWRPAQRDGVAVNFMMRVPITMVFE